MAFSPRSDAQLEARLIRASRLAHLVKLARVDWTGGLQNLRGPAHTTVGGAPERPFGALPGVSTGTLQAQSRRLAALPVARAQLAQRQAISELGRRLPAFAGGMLGLGATVPLVRRFGLKGGLVAGGLAIPAGAYGADVLFNPPGRRYITPRAALGL